MSLRSKLIRLAHKNPEVRAAVLPLLKTAGADAQGGKTASRDAGHLTPAEAKARMLKGDKTAALRA